ncbi:MAG: DUF4387 domain-containing protein [Turicibacter sp.]|nr:DUF4387 domain-containing protein [Turicibacter sp.]
MRTKLSDIAHVIRSKNSGPFELTYDFMLNSSADFWNARLSGCFTPKGVSGILGIDEGDILAIVWFEPSNALKITVKRPIPSGDLGERDVYGAQQAAPFWEVEW